MPPLATQMVTSKISEEKQQQTNRETCYKYKCSICYSISNKHHTRTVSWGASFIERLANSRGYTYGKTGGFQDLLMGKVKKVLHQSKSRTEKTPHKRTNLCFYTAYNSNNCMHVCKTFIINLHPYI